jgi:hypothetical protein
MRRGETRLRRPLRGQAKHEEQIPSDLFLPHVGTIESLTRYSGAPQTQQGKHYA